MTHTKLAVATILSSPLSTGRDYRDCSEACIIDWTCDLPGRIEKGRRDDQPEEVAGLLALQRRGELELRMLRYARMLDEAERAYQALDNTPSRPLPPVLSRSYEMECA